MRPLGVVLAFIVLLIGFTTGHAQATTKLTFNNYLPPTHIGSKVSAEWCREIEKRTNGEVKFMHMAGGQLLKGDKVFEGVVQGIADAGFTNLAYTRGRFPEMEICDLPLGMPSGWVSTHVVNRFYAKFKPKGFDKAQILYFAGSGPNLISTTTTPVKTLADLHGETLRATGRIADTAAALAKAIEGIAGLEKDKLLVFGGWVNCEQQKAIDYLLGENRVLREQLGGRRLRRDRDLRRGQREGVRRFRRGQRLHRRRYRSVHR